MASSVKFRPQFPHDSITSCCSAVIGWAGCLMHRGSGVGVGSRVGARVESIANVGVGRGMGVGMGIDSSVGVGDGKWSGICGRSGRMDWFRRKGSRGSWGTDVGIVVAVGVRVTSGVAISGPQARIAGRKQAKYYNP